MRSSDTFNPALAPEDTGAPVNFSRLVREQAMRHPRRPAIILPGRRPVTITAADLDRLADTFVQGLQEAGITRGTRTVLMARPGEDFFPLILALFRIGAVPVIVDPGMGMRRMLHCLRSTGAEAFVGIPAAHMVRLCCPGAFSTITSRVTVGRRWFWGGASTREMKRRVRPPGDIAPTSADELAAIVFTTGSTGPPKGVEYTHGMFTAMIRLLEERFAPAGHEIDLATFPLFALFDVAMGITAVFPDMDPARPAKADPRKIIAAIDAHGVTTMFASPALLKNLAADCERRGVTLPSLQRIMTGGAPVEADLLVQLSGVLPPTARIHVSYGATEAVPIAAIDHREVLTRTRARTADGRGTCVGRPFAEVELAVIRISDGPFSRLSPELLLPVGKVGEVIIRGPVVSRHYHERPDEDRLSKIRDGETFWHRLGDLGRLDEQGRLWLCGRKQHRVTTGSETLFTVPCEGIFNAHPQVARSALVGVNGRPVMCIEPAVPRRDRDRDRLRRELLDLARAHPLTRGIETIMFPPSFPVDVRHNVKISRERLADWARRHLS